MNLFKLKNFFFGLLFLSMIACNKQMNGGEIKVGISTPVSENLKTFSFNLFKNVQQNSNAADNIFISPLSLHMDLGMLLNGTDGNTMEEIQKTLELGDISLSDMNKSYATLLNGLPSADKQVNLGLYNSLWYRQEFSINNEFKQTLTKYFDAYSKGLAFNPSDNTIINQWISDKTNGKIKDVVDAIDPSQVLYLINALYFKGNWKDKFDKSATVDYDFHLNDGSSKKVKMMFLTSEFKTTSKSNYRLIQLPYGNGQFSMTLVIPNEGITIEDVMSNFDRTSWNQFEEVDIPEIKAMVGLPRFHMDYNKDLIPVMKAMGIKDVFNPDLANLTKINPMPGLMVNILKQFTYLNVDEEGTEAAAVTVTGVSVTSVIGPPPSFICDHPFGIIISEKTSHTILFMGRVMNPISE